MLSRFSHVRLFIALWTVARQVALCMGFPRQEYWSGLPFSSLTRYRYKQMIYIHMYIYMCVCIFSVPLYTKIAATPPH